MARGKRTRIERGIYSDSSGLSAVVHVGTLQREKRFPPDTDRDELRKWRADTESALITRGKSERTQRADARTIARSVASYLKRRTERAGYKSDRSHLKAWLPALGHKRRHEVTADDLRVVLKGWAKLRPATIRHRVRVLREMYQALDGADIRHPATDIDLPKVARPSPIPVSHALIRKVATSLDGGKSGVKRHGPKRTLAVVHYPEPPKTRGRFLVYATTGQRPAQIGRALPGDVDLERRLWFVRPAKGGEPIPLPLSDDMVKAWWVFIAAKAWGMFDPTGLAKVLRRHGWPKGIRPYMLRHTFAIDMLLAGADLGDVQGLLGHADIHTTRKFYAPILISRLSAAVARRDSVLPVPDDSVPRSDSTRVKIVPQIATKRARRNAARRSA